MLLIGVVVFLTGMGLVSTIALSAASAGRVPAAGQGVEGAAAPGPGPRPDDQLFLPVQEDEDASRKDGVGELPGQDGVGRSGRHLRVDGGETGIASVEPLGDDRVDRRDDSVAEREGGKGVVRPVAAPVDAGIVDIGKPRIPWTSVRHLGPPSFKRYGNAPTLSERSPQLAELVNVTALHRAIS